MLCCSGCVNKIIRKYVCGRMTIGGLHLSNQSYTYISSIVGAQLILLIDRRFESLFSPFPGSFFGLTFGFESRVTFSFRLIISVIVRTPIVIFDRFMSYVSTLGCLSTKLETDSPQSMAIRPASTYRLIRTNFLNQLAILTQFFLFIEEIYLEWSYTNNVLEGFCCESVQ